MFAEQIAAAWTVWFAALTCVGVLVEYLILVPLRKNRGAKRLVFLLSVAVVLLGFTLGRIYLGDWHGRYEAISAGFVVLAACFIYLGWTIWTDQHEGARAYRVNNPHGRAEQ